MNVWRDLLPSASRLVQSACCWPSMLCWTLEGLLPAACDQKLTDDTFHIQGSERNFYCRARRRNQSGNSLSKNHAKVPKVSPKGVSKTMFARPTTVISRGRYFPVPHLIFAEPSKEPLCRRRIQ